MLGLAFACVSGAPAANNSVQGGQKKEQGGFESGAPYAILIEAESGSVLYEKNADQLTSPSNMLKLMTAEVVFNELKKGTIKLTDEYRVTEYAWRTGGAPAGGSTMFAALKSQIKVEDLLRGLAVHERQRFLHHPGRGHRRQRERLHRDDDQAGARARADAGDRSATRAASPIRTT